ncbi:MAG: hypothetical protein RL264_302 [Bacteroidota bacterium]|jgi:gliding motility-associated lipoprotein GldD
MKYAILIVLLGVLLACGEENPIPKPPTYLRTDFPEHSYHFYENDCPYSMEISDLFQVKTMERVGDAYCSQEVDLGPLNGTLFLFYMRFNHRDSLAALINYSNDKVDEHKIKADRIDYEQISNKINKVYGTFFELKGNVATNFQFYLTDSTKNFIRGEILLNCRPNYDSLRPVLNYLKEDVLHLAKGLKWKSTK